MKKVKDPSYKSWNFERLRRRVDTDIDIDFCTLFLLLTARLSRLKPSKVLH